MQAGELDRLITIQRVVNVPTDSGGTEESWLNVDNVWAKEMPIAGREYLGADQMGALVNTKFRIRYRTGLNETMRIIFDSRIYEIRHIANVGRMQWLDIIAEAVKINGS